MPRARKHWGFSGEFCVSSGWPQRRLGELAELRGRIGWRGLTAKEYTDTGPLFLSVPSLNHGDYVDFRGAAHITERRYLESPEIMLREDDVLICKDGAGIGKVGIVGNLPHRATINSSLLLVRSGPSIRPRFLYRCLSSPYFQAIARSRLNGATTPHLYQRDIAEFPIVLPPLSEQDRIVASLDGAFGHVTVASANARRNLENPRALFMSHLHAVFRGAAGANPQLRIGDVCRTSSGGTPLKSRRDYYDGGTVPWLLSGELGQGDIHEATHFISQAGLADSSAKVFPAGTVLVAMYGATAGHVAILRIEAATNQAICGILPSEHFVPEFLYYFLLSEQDNLVAQAVGNAQPNISQATIRDTFIPAVPRPLQEVVVTELETMLRSTQHLESIYQRKIAAIDELKASLLHQAFSGNL